MEKGKNKVLHFRLPKEWEFDPNSDEEMHPDYKKFVEKAYEKSQKFSEKGIEVTFYLYSWMAIGYKEPEKLALFLNMMES